MSEKTLADDLLDKAQYGGKLHTGEPMTELEAAFLEEEVVPWLRSRLSSSRRDGAGVEETAAAIVCALFDPHVDSTGRRVYRDRIAPILTRFASSLESARARAEAAGGLALTNALKKWNADAEAYESVIAGLRAEAARLREERDHLWDAVDIKHWRDGCAVCDGIRERRG